MAGLLETILGGQDKTHLEENEQRGTGLWRYVDSDIAIAIRWDRKDQEKSHQQIVEHQLSKMAGGVTREVQESHRYGDLMIAFKGHGGLPDVYRYYNVPYQTYYYMWKATASIGRYIYYSLTRQHMRKNNSPQSFKAVCPYRYEKIGNFFPINEGT